MIKKKYQFAVKSILGKYLPDNAKIFVFGSSAREKDFADIDIGVKNVRISSKTMLQLNEDLHESLIPYKVDVVDFSKVGKKFEEKVFENKVIWLT